MADVQNKSKLMRREQTALKGLRLSYMTLQRLKDRGIYCEPGISVVFQGSRSRYVIRAQESGGCVAELGAYCGLVSEEGEALPWFQRVETIGVNGLHARTVSVSLVRIQVVRVMHTYDLLITKHELRVRENGGKPDLANSILFHERQGTLELELWGRDSSFRGQVHPIFYDRGGDPLDLPERFKAGVYKAIAGATCPGCTHSHMLVPPDPDGHTTAESALLGPIPLEATK